MTAAVSAAGRAATVAAAQASIANGSKSFAAASRLFDRKTRERAWLLYAWCRACDDIADGQDHGGAMRLVPDPQARLATLVTNTDLALSGAPVGSAPFDALRIVAGETGLPHHFVRDHVAGFALDAAGWRPQTEADLLRYCYHVAGVVGCMMAVVMGVDPSDDATLDRACDLGLAFQLANIARDVAEDAGAGRCYLPADWLTEENIAEAALLAPQNRASVARLSARLAERAARYEASARHGTPALPFRSAWAVLAAAAIYGEIAREVARRGAAALDARVATPALQKLRFIIAARGQAANRHRYFPAQRRAPDLWQRPRHG